MENETTTEIFCVLASDSNLTGFPVDFDVSRNVGSFKKAVYANRSSRLVGIDAADLTLVRICNGDVGGLSPEELKASGNLLSLDYYGKCPEDEVDNVSMFSPSRGVHKTSGTLVFKVMNSMEEVSFFTKSLPKRLHHVLVLVPKPVEPKAPPSIQDSFIKELRKAFAVVNIGSVSPSLSETALGQTTLRKAKEYNLFHQHEHDPSKEPMLSQSDAEDFALLTDDKLSEKLFDVKMTRIFQNALGPDVHLVNSEECGWLMQGGDSSTDFKPDFHVTVKGLYMHKEEPDDAVQEARRLVHETYGTVFRFGTPPKELWGMITILERKLKFTEGRDFGQVIRYLQHLNNHHEGGNAVLFDKTRCWLIRAREKNVLYSIENVDWLAGGSKEKFVNFVHSSLQPWKGLILDACNHFNVDLVNEKAFLGTGATGRVFKVCRTTNGKTNYYALKIVLKPNNLSLISECRMLKAAEKTGVVVSVVGEFKQFGNGTGGGLLISPVGVPVNRAKLTQSLLHRVAKVLFALHLEGLQHGDPRLPNLIQFKRQLYWIDLMASILDGEYRWREDASALSRSVLGLHQDDNLPENITALIDQYALDKNEAACLALADGWWSELQFQS